MDLSDLANAVSAALSALNRRLLTLLALVMVFGLFCFAMVAGQSWLHLAIAGAFGIIVFLPVLYHERAGGPREVSDGKPNST